MGRVPPRLVEWEGNPGLYTMGRDHPRLDHGKEPIKALTPWEGTNQGLYNMGRDQPQGLYTMERDQPRLVHHGQGPAKAYRQWEGSNHLYTMGRDQPRLRPWEGANQVL